MKTALLFIISLMAFSLTAQERGVTPVANPQSAIRTPQSKTYAVVVGISDYQDEGIPDLRFADKDAEAFANFLRSPAGGQLDVDHLNLLTNDQATAAQVSIALDWLMDVCQEGDRVIIYFSGHGDVEAKRLSQPGYLLGWDAPPQVYMGGGAINIRDLQDIVSTLSVENKAKVILITDACRSGKLSGSDIDGAQLTSQNLARQFENEIKILSCQPNEYSIEGEQWGGGRGAFSYHLINGLYGLADGNGDISVNLMELGRYLQDKVTTEVAPQSQVPMTVGDFTEKLVSVNPNLLENIKNGKKGQLQLFTSTESRGIEDEVLAAADPGIVELYLAFKKSLIDKQFLEPANASTDFYFEKLSREPQLEKLHSSMRRNYAAALQDDAQQELNDILKIGLSKADAKGRTPKDVYGKYPVYLKRAEQVDPTSILVWYVKGVFYDRHGKFEAAEKYYLKAIEGSGNDICFPCAHHNLGSIYAKTDRYTEAEQQLNKALQLDTGFTRAYVGLAGIYAKTGRAKEADHAIKKMIALAPNDASNINSSGWFYLESDRLKEAEAAFLEAIRLDSTAKYAHPNLGLVYAKTGRYEEAETKLQKGLELDPENSRQIYVNYALLYSLQNRIDEAFTYLEKALAAGYSLNETMHISIEKDPDLEPMRAYEERWNSLMKKYFPAQGND